MTNIQQVLFELDGRYMGHPYFVTGNALFNAIARRLEDQAARALHVSHGVFVPGSTVSTRRRHLKMGTRGSWVSRSGGRVVRGFVRVSFPGAPLVA